MAVAAVEILIFPVQVENPVTTLIPVVDVTVQRKADADVVEQTGIEIETIDRQDRNFPILLRWMIRHFLEGMKEDVRPADVNRTHENDFVNMSMLKPPEPVNTVQGVIFG